MKIFKRGFTLVELMIVMTVMAILATLAFFGFRQAQASARDASRNQIMSSVRTQLERYYGDNQTYPRSAAAIGFTDMATSIGYPTGTVSDPGCGTGAIAYVATDLNAAHGWYPTPVNCTFTNRPVYQYSGLPAGCLATVASPCSSYVLTLTKEGGGTGTFNSPN